jgi:hypothetical protein
MKGTPLVKLPKSLATLSMILIFSLSTLHAGKYYVLCEGNIGQTNASLWAIDESLETIEGPILWNTSSNPLGDVGQSLTLYGHTLYIVMNGSHQIRVLNLESGETHAGDIDVPNSSPRFMAIHGESGLGYISSWGLSALLIVNLENNVVLDTLHLGARPEEMLIVGDELFVGLAIKSDSYDSENKILRIDIGSNEPTVTHVYDVIDGPGAMALIGDQLYVTSIYYNDAWETFTGSSRMNLTDHSVVTLDHGLYSNFIADLNIIDGIPYRTFGSSVVPLNADLTLNLDNAIGDIAGIYSHSIGNNHLLVGSGDFVAPDLVSVLSLSGLELASFNVGALPSQTVYYSPDLVDIEANSVIPATFSLGNNYPNPFNPATSIPFALNKSEVVTLKIYDIRGSLVSTVMSAHLNAGSYTSIWDGTNAKGFPVSGGVYHAVMTSPSQTSSIKVTLLK